jgi:hypothetical protein
MAGKAVVKQPDDAEHSVVEAAVGDVPRRNDHLGDSLRRELQDPEVSRAQAHAAIIHQILNSADVDSVLEVYEAQTLADFEGRHIRIDSHRFNDSEFEEGPPVYVSLMVVDVEAGTKHLINSGEQAIIAQVLKLEELDAFPLECKVWLAAKPNRYGRRLSRLAKWEKPNG